jgi:hypothetical protein
MIEITEVYDPVTDITTRALIGEATAKEMIDYAKSASQDQQPGKILWDYTNGAVEPMSRQSIKQIVDICQSVRFNPPDPVKVALVLKREIDFRSSRIFQAINNAAGGPFDIGIFADIDLARCWLLSDTPGPRLKPFSPGTFIIETGTCG